MRLYCRGNIKVYLDPDLHIDWHVSKNQHDKALKILSTSRENLSLSQKFKILKKRISTGYNAKDAEKVKAFILNLLAPSSVINDGADTSKNFPNLLFQEAIKNSEFGIVSYLLNNLQVEFPTFTSENQYKLYAYQVLFSLLNSGIEQQKKANTDGICAIIQLLMKEDEKKFVEYLRQNTTVNANARLIEYLHRAIATEDINVFDALLRLNLIHLNPEPGMPPLCTCYGLLSRRLSSKTSTEIISKIIQSLEQHGAKFASAAKFFKEKMEDYVTNHLPNDLSNAIENHDHFAVETLLKLNLINLNPEDKPLLFLVQAYRVLTHALWTKAPTEEICLIIDSLEKYGANYYTARNYFQEKQSIYVNNALPTALLNAIKINNPRVVNALLKLNLINLNPEPASSSYLICAYEILSDALLKENSTEEICSIIELLEKHGADFSSAAKNLQDQQSDFVNDVLPKCLFKAINNQDLLAVETLLKLNLINLNPENTQTSFLLNAYHLLIEAILNSEESETISLIISILFKNGAKAQNIKTF